MVVGFMNISPKEIVGNSSGTPPAAQTPRLTDSATMRRCALQLFSSLHELQMPITGLFRKTLAGNPAAPSAARPRRHFSDDPHGGDSDPLAACPVSTEGLSRSVRRAAIDAGIDLFHARARPRAAEGLKTAPKGRVILDAPDHFGPKRRIIAR